MPGTIISITQVCKEFCTNRRTRSSWNALMTIRINELDDAQAKEFANYISQYNPDEANNV